MRNSRSDLGSIHIMAAENGVIVEEGSRGDAPGNRHVFNDPTALGQWVTAWAEGLRRPSVAGENPDRSAFLRIRDAAEKNE